jgi:hypothetical protein
MMSTRRAMAITLLLLSALAVVGFLWRMKTLDAADGARGTDRYEGSSGMGADGFGGFPSKPE